MADFLHKSIPSMLRVNAKLYENNTALSYKKDGKYFNLTYKELYLTAIEVSRGLKRMGIRSGDKVAVLSETNHYWAYADFGILNLGAVEVPIYHTDSSKQVAYILNHSASKAIFVSTKSQYIKLLEVKDELPSLEFIVGFEKFLIDKFSLFLYFN